ncbi:alpha/beta hydrolase [Pseudoalteromonas distincta]|uniref:Alpha/beta hydrolase n=2 Tax=Pseudoalteromonas distincta TaxID=77608 RepID=A0A4P9J0H1_9GAMM|nr:alpha/beta hydrolase [Pseudoalteromonas distincta]
MLLLFSPVFVNAGEIYEQFPDNVDPNGKYVFYSHGKIVEGENTNPVSPRWGEYDFPEVKDAISSNNYNLIAYHRIQNTNPKTFALKLTNDVKKLITLGVKPQNITLLGFSRGGEITILASRHIQNPDINIILLASCANFMKNNEKFEVYGNIYSIYETSDMVGSCQFLINQSPGVNSFSEISISTGKEHGAFFTPIIEWVQPVKNWLGGNV